VARSVYVSDITVGELPQQHGHWADRLPAIEKDIELVAEKLEAIKPAPPSAAVSLIIQKIASGVGRGTIRAQHTPTKRFVPGTPVKVELKLDEPSTWAKLYYRHVNQAERFNVSLMEHTGSVFSGLIPGDYANTVYPLQYYFEVKATTGVTHLFPGFKKDLTNEPYFVVRSR
jgi:hypothetical protein